MKPKEIEQTIEMVYQLLNEIWDPEFPNSLAELNVIQP